MNPRTTLSRSEIDPETVENLQYPLVRLTKLRQVPTAQVPSANWDNFVPGSWTNQESLPVDYELVGFLLSSVRVGCAVQILRLERNGVREPGVFESTPVVTVHRDGFQTRNSVYRLEPYPGM